MNPIREKEQYWQDVCPSQISQENDRKWIKVSDKCILKSANKSDNMSLIQSYTSEENLLWVSSAEHKRKHTYCIRSQ